MQVGIDVKCMCIKFGGHSLFGFGDTGTFYSPWSSKILIDRNRPKKFMQVWIDVKCMHIKFGGRSLSGFGDIGTFKNSQISLSNHGLYSPWSSKKLIDRNWPKKFMQVGIDVTCMYIDFGGRGLFGFGDIGTFKNSQISLSTHGLYPWSSKILIDRNRPKKFMQVWIDVKCMHIKFGGHGLFGFGDISTFKNGLIIVHGHQKI